jgi:hypothetical protein
MTTAFGWIAGAALGVLVNYVLFVIFGASYPAVPTTFVLFVAGAFGGMTLGDRLGPRGFRPLGLAAGLLLALALTLVAAVLMGQAE